MSLRFSELPAFDGTVVDKALIIFLPFLTMQAQQPCSLPDAFTPQVCSEAFCPASWQPLNTPEVTGSLSD